MNLKSGFRRLALILAIVGFGIGGSAALRSLNQLRQRADQHKRFTALASSFAVQRELARIQNGKKYRAKSSVTGENHLVFWSGEQPPKEDDVSRIVTDGYPVRAGEVEAIGLNYDGALFFFRHQSGETIYDAISPVASEYWLTALFPVTGFVIPFVILTVMSWLAAGFSASPK